MLLILLSLRLIVAIERHTKWLLRVNEYFANVVAELAMGEASLGNYLRIVVCVRCLELIKHDLEISKSLRTWAQSNLRSIV